MPEYIEIASAAGLFQIDQSFLFSLKWASALRALAPQFKKKAENPEVWLSRFWEQANSSNFKVPVYLALHPWLTMLAIHCIIRLPRLNARLRDNPEGKLIAEALNRICLTKIFKLADVGASVLNIPVTPQDYSLGSSKQTLRRKARAAERLGITCRYITDESEHIKLVAMLDSAISLKSNPLYRERGSDHSYLVGSGLWTVAFAHNGEPLVIAVTPRDGEWALLQAFVSLGETQERSDARYLLTKVLVERLAGEGVRHLVDTRGPSQLPNGLRHFQRMLGFRISRIRILQ